MIGLKPPNLFNMMKSAFSDGERFKRFAKRFGLSEPYKLHIGCGGNILPNWVNIDLRPISKTVFVHDVRRGLPFNDSSVKFIFSEHFIEHLTKHESKVFFKECFRVLVRGGVMRLCFPELSFNIERYLKRLEWPTTVETETYCDKMNLLFYANEHKYIYDKETLEIELKRVGFKRLVEVEWGKSSVKELNGLEGNKRFKVPCFEAFK